MKVFHGIDKKQLEEILGRIRNIRIALIGDLCIDIYWKADMTKSELSRETPHFPLPVVEERMSPGAGGNAAANIAALKPGNVKVLGAIGRDWRGNILKEKFEEAGIDTSCMVESPKIITNAYCKPYRKGISNLEYEDPRIDFVNYANLPREVEEELLQMLGLCAGNTDILCVSDQFAYGCITPVIREKITSLAANGLRVVVDSRDRIGLYSGVILKPNEVEGMKAAQNKTVLSKTSLEEFAAAARFLAEKNESDICMTVGPKGCLYADHSSVTHIPSYDVQPPIDICGAGDTFLAAFSCAIAAGAEACEAASFANMAADVTIRKVGVTGTANPDEIRSRHEQILALRS